MSAHFAKRAAILFSQFEGFEFGSLAWKICEMAGKKKEVFFCKLATSEDARKYCSRWTIAMGRFQFYTTFHPHVNSESNKCQLAFAHRNPERISQVALKWKAWRRCWASHRFLRVHWQLNYKLSCTMQHCIQVFMRVTVLVALYQLKLRGVFKFQNSIANLVAAGAFQSESQELLLYVVCGVDAFLGRTGISIVKAVCFHRRRSYKWPLHYKKRSKGAESKSKCKFLACF